MKFGPNGYLLRVLCLIWAAFWFLLWIGTTIVSLAPHTRLHSHSFLWFRTGALMAAWAGLFAWKALEPPRR